MLEDSFEPQRRIWIQGNGRGPFRVVTAIVGACLGWSAQGLAQEPAPAAAPPRAPAPPQVAQTGLSPALLRRLTRDTRDASTYFFAASGWRNMQVDAQKVTGPGAVEVTGPGAVEVPESRGTRPAAIRDRFLSSHVAVELQLQDVFGGRQLDGRKVFHGKPVPPSFPSERNESDSFDDVVAVGSESQWSCSGVQVGGSFVLTAAHCLPATRVGIGHDLSRLRQTIGVRAVHRVPDGLDVAVLELSQPLTTAPRPWRLAGQSEAPFGQITVVGFGADDERGHLGAGVMRRASFPINGWGCDGFRAQVLGCRPTQELVVKSLARNDTCNGDSGGPVFEEVAGQSRLLAITSRPIPTRGSRCGNGGIYVRLDAIASWMLAIISGKHARPQETEPTL